jgi:hypothetical protein
MTVKMMMMNSHDEDDEETRKVRVVSLFYDVILFVDVECRRYGRGKCGWRAIEGKSRLGRYKQPSAQDRPSKQIAVPVQTLVLISFYKAVPGNYNLLQLTVNCDWLGTVSCN